MSDPTRIDIDFDPTIKRMSGVAHHGMTPFDVPYISEVGHNLWQGGCADGLILPKHIKHVVSLYKWEQYTVTHDLDSSLTVTMYDSIDQSCDQVDALARWVNLCRESGPVLVHCQAGLNRSSLVAARALYLQAKIATVEPLRGGYFVDHLRDARSPACLCNPAFEAEVRSWQ